MKIALLSFDVEEFDMPLEYKGNPTLEKQIKTSTDGLDILIKLLTQYKTIATFYCTGVFAQQKPLIIKELSKNHEIASHNFFHSSHKKEDLLASKELLSSITQQKIVGFRMPRMAPIDDQDLAEAGYQYNSSINPTWLPGRYDNRHISRNHFKQNGLLHFPASVSPKLRIPLFWIAFHNLPLAVYFWLIKRTLAKDGYVHLYFHPWEFTEYTHENNGAKYPFYLKRNNGKKMAKRFEKLLIFLKKEGCNFQTTSQFLGLEDITNNLP